MSSVNKVILIGRLGKDPDVRYTPDGKAMANISLATSYSWKYKNTGDRREETEWHRISFFDRQAEVVGEYLKKGSQIYVEGRLRTRKYTDSNNIERYVTEIMADTMRMLGNREDSFSQDNGYSSQGQAPTQQRANPPQGNSYSQSSGGGYAQASGGSANRRPPPQQQSNSLADIAEDPPF